MNIERPRQPQKTDKTMPDYIYMLESRLSAEQRAAMMRVQELAAENGSNIYLVGGAVRDLISGASIRDLDFTIEGNPSRLARELEKGGAKIVDEDEKMRTVELLFSGAVEGSISAAREEVYDRPGTKPEIRWSSIIEDLHRRDFSINAIALSLNPASRGLLLDPTNGLADLDNKEVRALSIHSFTNQPVRLLRALRYCARMDFHMEARTADWFALALERSLADAISPEDVGDELRQLAVEEKPAAILKVWEGRDLLRVVHPQLERRHPDYELIARILRARNDLRAAGLRPRLASPVTYAVLGRLQPRERSSALHRLGYSSAEVEAIAGIADETEKFVKMLAGRKTAAPPDAYAFLEKAPSDAIAMIIADSSNSKAVNKIRNYLQRWRPLRQALPAAVLELETIGMARGPKFDKVIESLFNQQLLGKGRSPEDRVKLLRKISGIKEAPPPKKEEKGKKKPTDRLKARFAGKASEQGAPAQGTNAPAAAQPPQAPAKPVARNARPVHKTPHAKSGTSKTKLGRKR